MPKHFEQAAQTVSVEDVAETVVCGPDPEGYVKQVKTFTEAGFDHIYFHPVGRDQEGFFRFWERELQSAI